MTHCETCGRPTPPTEDTLVLAKELQAAGLALSAAAQSLTLSKRAVPAQHASVAARRALELVGRFL
jgi:hypothetical protein